VDTTITLYHARDDWLELTLDIAWAGGPFVAHQSADYTAQPLIAARRGLMEGSMSAEADPGAALAFQAGGVIVAATARS
jgi:hypothetical protein